MTSETPFDHPFERGMRNRRAALGDAWVDQSVSKANDFNAEFQHFITDYAWHGVWGRPGLDWKTRRAMVLAITSALGRWDEFEIHLRGALTPGNACTLTPAEVREALFQVAIYAGVPAANTAFARAVGILRELGLTPEPRSAAEAWHTGVGRSVFTGSRPKLHATVREARQGPARHTVVLSHALGLDHSMWDAVANELSATCRVICPDTRGHGRSELPAGALSLTDLADDAARLIDEVAEEPVVWVGLSMGGMIGQELALRRPDRVKALVLANTTGRQAPESRTSLGERVAAVQAHGMQAVGDATMERFFTPGFRQTQAAAVQRHLRLLLATDPEGYVACAGALGEVDTLDRLTTLQMPALVIVGEDDHATPPAMGQALCSAMSGAQYQALTRCAHLSAAEQPTAFAAVVSRFIGGL